MWQVERNDIDALRRWGHLENPFAALEDYSLKKEELRWLNPDHRQLHLQYVETRLKYIGDSTMIDYFRKVDRTIDRDKWEYLKLRKAWYMTPIGWQRFLESDCTIADFGYGDGDCLQRVGEFVAHTSNKVHLVGYDFNASRVRNGQNLTRSGNSKVTFEFVEKDVLQDAFDGEAYDYSLVNGFFEILNDDECRAFMTKICRVTRKGIYVQDIVDPFPGGYPRLDICDMFADFGFRIWERHVLFTEPFAVDRCMDPKRIFPIIKVQNLWLERVVD